MSWDREVLDVLADGYDVHYGARSIKHEVRLIYCLWVNHTAISFTFVVWVVTLQFWIVTWKCCVTNLYSSSHCPADRK